PPAPRPDPAPSLGADPRALVFVQHASARVRTALPAARALLAPGDEILVTDHEYNAAANAAAVVAAETGARIRVARLPWPDPDADAIVAAVLGATGPRTRVALVSHVTRATATVLPIGPIVAGLEARGVATIVDSAHGPGLVPFAIDAIGASWLTGNAHKWLCAPKGAAVLHVRADRRAFTRPLVTSPGWNAPVPERARFLAEADWTGTLDPSPILAIPDALRALGALHPDGWPGLMAANRRDALAARDRLLGLTGARPLVPDALSAAMVLVPIPDALTPEPAADDPAADAGRLRPEDPLAAALRSAGIVVPVFTFPATRAHGPARRLLRVSWQRHVRAADIARLAEALRARGLGA
ncbi:MAG: aminotransferase class V-fold PLP-dependent enzyme, partial [Chloroflexota bacterium]